MPKARISKRWECLWISCEMFRDHLSSARSNYPGEFSDPRLAVSATTWSLLSSCLTVRFYQRGGEGENFRSVHSLDKFDTIVIHWENPISDEREKTLSRAVRLMYFASPRSDHQQDPTLRRTLLWFTSHKDPRSKSSARLNRERWE